MKKIKLKKLNPQASGSQGEKVRKIDYAAVLNTDQLKAVMHNQGPALVIAGAGTGKTRTVTHRVARLIEDGVPAEAILLLTFTRKAAREMKDRAAALLDSRVDGISAGTFHSFASMILRRFGNELGYPSSFNVLDSKDAEDTIAYVRQLYMEAKGLDYKSRRFPKESFIYKIYSASINKKESIENLVFSENQAFLEFVPFIEEIISRYAVFKKNASVMDYDDLLVNLLKIIKAGGRASDYIEKRYLYVMVDEYQDTNRLQHEISLALAGKEKNPNLMVVGDEAQSIYSFRGAEYNNILFFPKQFAECAVYKIETNYRSTQQVLDFSNALMKAAEFGYDKELKGLSQGEHPFVISTGNERQQSRFVIQDILEKRENGESLNEMAVLFRSGFHSFDLEVELDKENIRFQKYGGLRFSETAHIKDILSYLKVAANPGDIIALRRLLLLQPGIGNATAKKVIESVSENGKTLESEWYGHPNAEQLRKEILLIQKQFNNPDIAIDLAINNYRPILEKQYKDYKKREKDLEQFSNMVSGYKTIDAMLNDLAVDPPNSAVKELAGDDPEDEILTLSTIHSAKGLEWKHVYIIWALEGKFPSGRTGEDIDAIEEERRLFYVAATRAKEGLAVLHPVNIFDRVSGSVLSTPTRFLDSVSHEIAPRYVIEEEGDEDDTWDDDDIIFW